MADIFLSFNHSAVADANGVMVMADDDLDMMVDAAFERHVAMLSILKKLVLRIA